MISMEKIKRFFTKAPKFLLRIRVLCNSFYLIFWGNQMIVEKIARAMRPLLRVLAFLTPVGDLLARIWVASIFFRSGLVKISNWDATVALFTYVYHVPFMPPVAAAVLGTA